MNISPWQYKYLPV